jgi:hypothetical protein
MRLIETAISIQAPPAIVWQVLTDFPRYPAWNPFIPSLEGEAKAGTRLRVRIAPPGGRAMTFRPKLLAVEPRRELRWLGHLLVPGLFDGEHLFRLEPEAEGCTLHQSERFSGLLLALLGKGMFEATRGGFEAMNAALKAEAERIAGKSG